MRASLRQVVGAFARDVPRFAWGMRPDGRRRGAEPWVFVRNRGERLEPGPHGVGARCDWRWTSDLHVARVFPFLGRSLMRRAIRRWPFELADRPSVAGSPRVTFVVGHCGADRLPQLRTTLRSIAGQRGASVECVVVEQDAESRIGSALPPWVRHVHAPPPDPAMPYARAWALNVGARHARGELLVLHDGDMLVPRDYAGEALRRWTDGFRAINLKRFVFYLTEGSTGRLFASRMLVGRAAVAPSIVQNLEAGGSIAVDRSDFLSIGGFDESFVGWGGEDNEFWERASTLTVWPHGYLPMIHLWHAGQPEKGDRDRSTRSHYETRSTIDPADRIEELRARSFGAIAGPHPSWTAPRDETARGGAGRCAG